MREVMFKTNFKGKYDDNLDSEYDEDEVAEKQPYEKPEDLRRRTWGTTTTLTLTPSTTRMSVWR
jgi:hypothetical protein